MSATTENINISSASKLDALWTLFCSQPKSIQKAFAKRVKEFQDAEKLSKIEMTEKEFFAKLDHSIASAHNGPTFTMEAEETGSQFIDRLLSKK